ncbi:thiamine phosphate synthase [uncultured Polaribacter sp.]|uniref:thiamine phosphate synthase n=1 Tax=uncultured Polaribacter sp. TaxID=174711 RepID=UPI002627988F|nr:thiamine phosphate synthase [uncultured Polaribacter sp.]
MNYIPKVHYITQDIPGKTHQELAFEACKAGVELVQLRLKHLDKNEIYNIALETQKICKKFNVNFIINDHLDIAAELNADGVHLGNEDADHITARAFLGTNKIIGATAYNMAEAKLHQNNGIVDYIGVGTFKPTHTKPEIKTFLSLDEIAKMTEVLKKSFTSYIPILIIGGIKINDIKPLLDAGVYGIAIASLINKSSDKSLVLKTINNIIKNYK